MYGQTEPDDADLIDWPSLAAERQRLGDQFWRVLGYLHDEGIAAIASIENALRVHDAVAMIGPAERLKREAFPLGALRLAEIAETIELEARDCVESHQDPAPLIEAVVLLRSVFAQTVEQLRNDSNPLMRKSAVHRPNLLAA